MPTRRCRSCSTATSAAAPTSLRRREKPTRSSGVHSFRMRLRDLPSVDELARTLDDPLAVDAARVVLARARATIAAGGSPGDLEALLRTEVRALRAPHLRRVLNATGVLVHTNLGRAPLAEAALERVVETARGYSNLEYDLAEGRRGSRQDHVAAARRRLNRARAALVVNNHAA